MKLEEALVYRRKGYDIKRLGFLMSIEEMKQDYPVFTLNDIDADDWEVVGKFVGWREAWEALKAGQKVQFDDLVIQYRNREIKCLKTHIVWRAVPISWMWKKNFIILEDE